MPTEYKMPNDETENDRLDLQHNLLLMTFDDKLGNAPPNEKGAKVGRVLDIGTGSGIWAIDFGDEHPEAEVLGIDLSAAFPDFTPPNVKFEIDDLEEPWTYSRPFDYIHSRMMNGSVGDWELYAQRCFDNLNPGGYVEFNEANIAPMCDDDTLKPDSMMVKISTLVQQASEQFGRPARDAKDLKAVLIKAGFVDVKLLQFKWPTNTWPKEQRFKELGTWGHENIMSAWEGLCPAMLTRAHDWTREEVIVAMAELRKELRDRSIHAYHTVYSIYGRKPKASELETA
ncbi:methyltransferase domain-containing protein [Colletotrichum truncatum]|uniref:Methyltransferase domain-containing protein n=1 Tax=Colletotrichum truncatum TaxID=5467 RepID=A0ACC3YQY5_COLTU